MERTHSPQTSASTTYSRSQEPLFRAKSESSSENYFFQPSPVFNKSAIESKNSIFSSEFSPVSSNIIQAKFYEEPTKSTNPNAIIPVQDFITYVENVESSYPKDSPQNIITRIRQMYYSGFAFAQLIPDAQFNETVRLDKPRVTYIEHGMKVIEETEDRPRMLYKGEISDEAYNHLTARADENAKGDNPSPYILLDNGEQIDIGHLLLGLDALLHPNTGIPYSVYSVPNIDPSSWVADIGIAAVLMQYHEERGEPHANAPKKISSANFNEYYAMSAPEQDLIGDVDSFGLHSIHQQNANQNLSQTLRSYYLGDTQKVNNRWTTFCKENGFYYTRTGNTIQWLNSMIESYVVRINRFNDLYAAGTIGTFWDTLGSIFSEPPRGTWKYTRIAFNRFLIFVKNKLESELNKQ